MPDVRKRQHFTPAMKTAVTMQEPYAVGQFPARRFHHRNPWLAENPNYTKINVTDQLNRSDSVLSFYKELIALRKAPEYVETFTYGTFAAAYEDVDHMFAYYRTNEETGQRILVAGNFGTDTVTLPLEKRLTGCFLPMEKLWMKF